MGYRSDILFGDGYRDAAYVMAYETFELGNTDILETLSETIFESDDFKSVLEMYIGTIDNIKYDDFGIRFFKDVLFHIKRLTGKNIKYCLWLCDNKEDVYLYDIHTSLTDFDIDCYEESDIILSNLGNDGKLYGYESPPKKIKGV